MDPVRRPVLVDTREHRFQLTVVGVLVLMLTALRRPTWLVPVAVLTCFPVLPSVFRRLVAPHLDEPQTLEDRRLPAFARAGGGGALILAAMLTAAAPSKMSYAALASVGGICLCGGATGYCVPCSTLVHMERMRLVRLEPPLVCAVRSPR